MCNEKDDDDDDDELKDVCPDCMEFCEKCNLSFHPFCQAGHRKTCHARGRAERAVLVRKRLSMARNEISNLNLILNKISTTTLQKIFP